MSIEQEKLDALKAKHGEVHSLEHQGVTFIVIAPNRALWRRFRTQLLDDRKRQDALEHLLRDCVVHPAKEEVDRILDRKPGLVETFGKEICELAGGGGGEAEKKAL